MLNSLPASLPSQQAINGAFDLYVQGGKKDDVKQMLFGLDVLRQATTEQLQTAMAFLESSRGISNEAVHAMLERA